MSQQTVQPSNNTWLNEQLEILAQLPDLWTGLAYDIPNPWTIYWMKNIVHIQHRLGFCQGTLRPDKDGGVTMVFKAKKRYADIAVVNCEEILPLTALDQQGKGAKCWSIDPTDKQVEKAINHIREFLEQS